ncbi:pyridoxamine 5'-phosphate oxidase family protein [soil metagenome]
MTSDLLRTERTAHHRNPGRGSHDRAALEAIADEALVAHVGILQAEQVFVLPMVFVRVEGTLYLHGARASRLLEEVARGAPVGITITLVDGLVLAKSAFHQSMNYRSAMILGKGSEVSDPALKARVFAALVDKISPGRSAVARPANAKELAATFVVAVPIDEASVKMREGGPLDDEEDLALACWAGHVPLRVVAGAPIASHAGTGEVPLMPPALT